MDSILFWNDAAMEANRISHTYGLDKNTLGPTRSSRAIAIIHLAMYEAFAGAKSNAGTLTAFDSTRPAPSNPAKTSANGAIAGAAFKILSDLYPETTPHPEMNLAMKLTLAQNMFNEPDWLDGYNYGIAVATHLLNDRSGDPDASDMTYVPPVGRGAHKKDPDNFDQPYHGPFYGAGSRLFSATKRHALNQPPQPGTSDYDRYLIQVRDKGIAPELMGNVDNAKRRKVDETLVGVYWGYDGAKKLGTPPRLYNQIVRKVAMQKNNNLEQNARLFALVNVAMGDAGILAWEQKYVHNLWRPVVGIREHDVSLGDVTTPNDNLNNNADTEWLPFGAPKSNEIAKNFTPPFPAYPSGHATFGAAALHMTRLFYNVTGAGRDNLFNGLSFMSDEYNGVTTDNKGAVRPRHERKFSDGLWQMILENGFSRVYIGVHWAFDAFPLRNDFTADLDNIIRADGSIDPARNVGGVPLGLAIAEDIFKNFRRSTVAPVV